MRIGYLEKKAILAHTRFAIYGTFITKSECDNLPTNEICALVKYMRKLDPPDDRSNLLIAYLKSDRDYDYIKHIEWLIIKKRKGQRAKISTKMFWNELEKL